MEAWLSTAALASVLVPLFVLAERVDPEVERPPSAPSARRTDLVYLGFFALAYPLAGIGAWELTQKVGVWGIFRDELSHQPYWAGAAAAFAVAELGSYWLHRVEHKVTRLWRLHAVHHSATDVNWLTTFRFHPLDALMEKLGPVLVVAALGFPLSCLVPFLGAAAVVTLLAHCNVWVPGAWISRVVVTPGYHRTHHEVDRDGANFALVLPMVDVLFGTASFAIGERHFGTRAPMPASGFWAQLRWGLGFSSQRLAQRRSSTPSENDATLAT
ncbi:MAG TPA: sterol desaturase family protein [Acidimicrobiales bacterium]|nr:sterol desaturase family protein [Acidimicrobiales bacterium]